MANAAKPATCLRTCKNFRAKPEKALFVRKRVVEDIFEVCENNRESLSTALSLMSAYGYKRSQNVLNDIVNEVSAVSVKRSVK